MVEETWAICSTRRELLTAAAGFASVALLSPPSEPANADADDAVVLIKQLTGKTPTEFGSRSLRDAPCLSKWLYSALGSQDRQPNDCN